MFQPDNSSLLGPACAPTPEIKGVPQAGIVSPPGDASPAEPPPGWPGTLVRIGILLALGPFSLRLFQSWWSNPYDLTLPFLLATELVTLLLIVVSHSPRRSCRDPLSLAISGMATFYFYGLQLTAGTTCLPRMCCVVLIGTGSLWQIYAKLSLGRSFGIVPAQRQLVCRGAYRWVRHPIYLGYLISHCGFFLAHANWHNALVYGGLYGLQLERIRREECWLGQRASYRRYCRHLPWRLIPGVY